MVTIEQVKDQLKEVLVKTFPQFSDSMLNLSEDASLRDAGLQLDSIDLLLLVLEIEKRFGIRLVTDEFDEKIWENLNTLAQAIQLRMQRPQSS